MIVVEVLAADFAYVFLGSWLVESFVDLVEGLDFPPASVSAGLVLGNVGAILCLWLVVENYILVLL